MSIRIPKALKNGVILGMFIIIFLIMITLLQGVHDTLSPPFTTKIVSTPPTLLPAKLVPYVTFGLRNVIADYYWIQAVQHYVGWDTRDPIYVDYFDNISALDPKFEYPYLFSIWAIPGKGKTDLLQRVSHVVDTGIGAIPASWKIPFYFGTQYYFQTKEFDKALGYIKIAVEKKAAPPGAYLTYSTLLTKSIQGNPQGTNISQELVRIIYNNTDNETIKKLAVAGLQESTITQMLEKGITAYKAKYNAYPKSLDDLVQKSLVQMPKEFTDLFTVTINQKNGSFKLEARE
jgi:hypothetical protein